MADISPPPELFKQWEGMPRSLAFEAAYRAGADQELEACINYFHEYDTSWSEDSELVKGLRAARRPKPPSLKEQALAVLDDCSDRLDAAHENTLRRALEQLSDD